MPSTQTLLQDQYVAPELARYGQEQGAYLTQFLYSQKGANPYWDQPELWPQQNAVITLTYRALAFVAIAAGGGAQTQRLAILGGKNALILSRSCVIADNVYAAATVNGQNTNRAAYCTVQQQRLDGKITIDTQPVLNVFSNEPGWPRIPMVPERWYGNVEYNVAFVNNTTGIMDCTLGWEVAQLETGQ